MKLRADWNEFIASLQRHGVRYVVIGAHAVAVHGRPRYTEDFDVLVDATLANARRLRRALADFGFAAAARSWRRLARPYQVLFLGRVSGIDVLTSISGVSFRQAWKGRVIVRDPELGEVPVLGLTELRANKAASGRDKDLLDLAHLEELHPTRAAGRNQRMRRRRAAPRSRTRGTRRRKPA